MLCQAGSLLSAGRDWSVGLERAHMPSEYTDEFYKSLREGTRRSARAIVPIVLEFVRPRSVIDVGCGIGIWLSVFEEYGVSDIVGVDGDYVNRELLEISAERFMGCNLTEPLHIDRQFDLVVSLEVAEHLPSESAGTFVDSLTRLGPAILFSAAVPFQGGTHHVNEQWPDYWVRHFRAPSYVPIDLIRKRVWQNADVDFWYAQNSLIFVRKDELECYPLLREEANLTREAQLSIVHPKLILDFVKRYSSAAEACSTCQTNSETLKVDNALDKETAVRNSAEVESSSADAFCVNVEHCRSMTETQMAQADRFKAEAETIIANSEAHKTKIETEMLQARALPNKSEAEE
jgi:SAM-dependent methyltransferase